MHKKNHNSRLPPPLLTSTRPPRPAMVNHIWFHTGSSNTNPAKVSAVFSWKNQSNFKCIKVFQLSTKDNFWWCIVIQLNISCLFTILKSKSPCKLSLLTWILRFFSTVCGIYWLKKFNYAWRRPIKGLHILL